MKYIEPLFRPPAEANSLIFQVAYGCPHNECRFCGMYKQVKYRLRNKAELLDEIAQAGQQYPETTRVFLADGDVMALSFDLLQTYLTAINSVFPNLARINTYANGSSIAHKTNAELAQLRELKLNTIYMGLKSGSQAVLDRFGKKESVDQMISAVHKAQSLGIKCSVMILLGLGGREDFGNHAEYTAHALNLMQPRLLSALRYILIPNMPQPEGFSPLTEYETVKELYSIISLLELNSTIFRANHTSNPLPLSGRFPASKEKLLQTLSHELLNGNLDTQGVGFTPSYL